MKRRVLPPTYLLLAMLLIVLLHFLAPVAIVFAEPWNLLGMLPLGCGLAVTLASDRAFKRMGTTVNPYKEPTRLITEGAFRISRNPMYLGFVLVLLGMAILLRSVSSLPVVVAFAIVMDLTFIRVEERILEQTFADAWARYKQRVRKWI